MTLLEQQQAKRIAELEEELAEWKITLELLNARVSELEANEAEVNFAAQMMREKGILR